MGTFEALGVVHTHATKALAVTGPMSGAVQVGHLRVLEGHPLQLPSRKALCWWNWRMTASSGATSASRCPGRCAASTRLAKCSSSPVPRGRPSHAVSAHAPARWTWRVRTSARRCR